MNYFINKNIFGMANNYSHLQKHYILNYFGLQNNHFGIRAKFISFIINSDISNIKHLAEKVTKSCEKDDLRACQTSDKL